LGIAWYTDAGPAIGIQADQTPEKWWGVSYDSQFCTGFGRTPEEAYDNTTQWGYRYTMDPHVGEPDNPIPHWFDIGGIGCPPKF
jgi:hypothetical protein